MKTVDDEVARCERPLMALTGHAARISRGPHLHSNRHRSSGLVPIFTRDIELYTRLGRREPHNYRLGFARCPAARPASTSLPPRAGEFQATSVAIRRPFSRRRSVMGTAERLLTSGYLFLLTKVSASAR
jgi:hypothetical protein